MDLNSGRGIAVIMCDLIHNLRCCPVAIFSALQFALFNIIYGLFMYVLFRSHFDVQNITIC